MSHLLDAFLLALAVAAILMLIGMPSQQRCSVRCTD
jgi:hypothetical protein